MITVLNEQSKWLGAGEERLNGEVVTEVAFFVIRLPYRV